MRAKVFATLAATALLSLTAAPGQAAFLMPDFAPHYTVTELGSVPGLTGNYGGLTFKFDDPDTMLLGRDIFNGRIFTVGVTRDAVTNRVTGFSGTSEFIGGPNVQFSVSTTYGPNDVLFNVQGTNRLTQLLPDAADAVSDTSFSSLGIGTPTNPVSGVGFVPGGFDGAGKMKVVTSGGRQWHDIEYTENVDGSLSLVSATQSASLPGFPGIPVGGFVYVDGVNAGFNGNSLLVVETGASRIDAYEVDANGDPITSTRRDFLRAVFNPMDAAIDPITGDFFFTTSGFFETSDGLVSNNSIFRVSARDVAGPDPGPSPIPLPAAGWLLIGALGSLVALRRRRH